MNNIINTVYNITSWILINQDLFIKYIIKIILGIVIIFTGIFFAKFIEHNINRILTIKKIDSTINYFLSSFIRYAIITFFLITFLNNFGIQTTSIVAIIGAASLAICLALQNSLSNIAAGILLIIFKPLKIGEYVIINGAEGIVQNIQIFSTTLKTDNDRIIFIPNNKIINNNIINITREPNKRQDIIISVSYYSDNFTIKKILSEIINADKRIQHNKDVIIRLNNISQSSLDYLVRFWTTNNNSLPVYWDLLEHFKYALDIYGVTIQSK
ncbi:Small-conductance mechanosensitive channel [Candidatus Providencia siddallii]|uniref:Small-conductance mechanosensitive channel n=1 Tax=Candidatus Providencia siddallii TaxID=1715285 RepID=A0A0M6W792_9GAMM|nr:Small-conductance mechanosensitive channel [Candidatus Providencia siddallii]